MCSGEKVPHIWRQMGMKSSSGGGSKSVEIIFDSLTRFGFYADWITSLFQRRGQLPQHRHRSHRLFFFLLLPHTPLLLFLWKSLVKNLLCSRLWAMEMNKTHKALLLCCMESSWKKKKLRKHEIRSQRAENKSKTIWWGWRTTLGLCILFPNIS